MFWLPTRCSEACLIATTRLSWPASVVHHDQRAMLRVIFPHVMLYSFQQKLVCRRVKSLVGHGRVEIPLVDYTGHDDRVALGDLTEIGFGEIGQVVLM